MSLTHIIVVILGLCCGLIGLPLLGLWIQTWREVRNLDRVAMGECTQHGYIPLSKFLKIEELSVEGKPDQPVLVCPLCFEDKMNGVQAKLRGKK